MRRWGRLFPPRDQARKPLEVSQAWVEERLKDVAWVATARQRAYVDPAEDRARPSPRTSDTLKAAERGSVTASAAASGLEETHWLCPIEDRRGLNSTREGMVEGFTRGDDLLLVEYTGRLFRVGKASISNELATASARLGSDGEPWSARLLKLSEGRLFGRFFAASRPRLREAADRLGLHHLTNLGGRPAGL